MPSGYTAKIKDGISFNEFVMDCARAFGACIMLRDSPGGGDQIPERFEPSDYHTKALEQAKARLAELEAMSPEQCAEAALADYEESEGSRLRYLAERNEQRAAYEAMLAKVNAWTPPTSDHEGIKSFMRDQITESIRYDCGDYYEKPTERLLGPAWFARETAECHRKIAYHTDEHAKEIARTDERNDWIAALRRSLAEGAA